MTDGERRTLLLVCETSDAGGTNLCLWCDATIVVDESTLADAVTFAEGFGDPVDIVLGCQSCAAERVTAEARVER